MIEGVIHYYNTELLWRKVGVATPLEKNTMYYVAARKWRVARKLLLEKFL